VISYADRDRARQKTEDLCAKFSIDCQFKEDKSYDGSSCLEARFDSFYFVLYHDGALIYNSSKTVDLRFEIYDYDDTARLFKAAISSFFDMVINKDFYVNWN